MYAMKPGNFEDAEFHTQVIAFGSYVDDAAPPKKWLVSSWVLRLNWYALNDWHSVTAPVLREDFQTEQEYVNRLLERTGEYEVWMNRLRAELGAEGENIHVQQVISEVFAVTCMQEI